MMPKLKKHAPAISILLLAALVVALFFSPPSARLLSTIIIVFGVSTQYYSPYIRIGKSIKKANSLAQSSYAIRS